MERASIHILYSVSCEECEKTIIEYNSSTSEHDRSAIDETISSPNWQWLLYSENHTKYLDKRHVRLKFIVQLNLQPTEHNESVTYGTEFATAIHIVKQRWRMFQFTIGRKDGRITLAKNHRSFKENVFKVLNCGIQHLLHPPSWN